jgi:hypothetical protein
MVSAGKAFFRGSGSKKKKERIGSRAFTNNLPAADIGISLEVSWLRFVSHSSILAIAYLSIGELAPPAGGGPPGGPPNMTSWSNVPLAVRRGRDRETNGISGDCLLPAICRGTRPNINNRHLTQTVSALVPPGLVSTAQKAADPPTTASRPLCRRYRSRRYSRLSREIVPK